MKKEMLDLKFAPETVAEIKELEDKPAGFIAGYASTSDIDLMQDVVLPGAFQESIDERGLTGPSAIKLLLNHDWGKLAGVITLLEYRDDKLYMEAQLDLEDEEVRNLHRKAVMLGGLNFSVGFRNAPGGVNFVEDDQGRQYYEIEKASLYEVSVVPFPANEAAQMTMIKSGPATTLSEFEKRLVSLGLAKSRNDAARITQEVKSASTLFTTAEAPALEAKASENKPQPGLADHEKKRLLEALTSVKDALSRSGSEDSHGQQED